MKISKEEIGFGIVIAILIVALAIILEGCQQASTDGIKTTYGEWQDDTAMVLETSILKNSDKHVAVVAFKQKLYSLSCADCVVNEKVEIQFREVWLTLCENNHCELLDTNYQIRLK